MKSAPTDVSAVSWLASMLSSESHSRRNPLPTSVTDERPAVLKCRRLIARLRKSEPIFCTSRSPERSTEVSDGQSDNTRWRSASQCRCPPMVRITTSSSLAGSTLAIALRCPCVRRSRVQSWRTAELVATPAAAMSTRRGCPAVHSAAMVSQTTHAGALHRGQSFGTSKCSSRISTPRGSRRPSRGTTRRPIRMWPRRRALHHRVPPHHRASVGALRERSNPCALLCRSRVEPVGMSP
mmetsp:Transcript_32351/g.100090  ORF Transcript_32351/g.100090 Transcript_32351/m.100090 type:complete len:238 (-) Transcript_32351:209-922(-)